MKLLCKIIGHKKPLETVRCVEPLTIYEFKCTRCGKELAYNRRMQALLPLDDELKEAHDIILGIKP